MNRFLLILAGMLAVPWNLSAAPRKKQTPAGIVVNGQPSAVILLSERPTRSAQFAALELQYHIEKMTGVKLPLERGKTSHPGTRIRVGGAGSGKKPFEFQEYEIQVGGKDILLTGCDDEDFTEVDYRKSSTFPGIWKKIGTVYAVYDFLERLGFRWYLPTDLGIAFERKTSLKAPVLSIRRKPTMEMRNMFPMYNAIPADLCGDTIAEAAKDARLNPRDTSLWYLRRRMGGRWVIINHSMYTFYPRFLKKHPDWFAKGYGSGRAGQLCYTNPEVIRQVVQDARNYFDGKLKAASQVLSNVPADYRSDVFPVFPMDNRSFCRCPVCSKYTPRKGEVTRGVGDFSNDHSSEYLFRFVNEVAKQVKKSHPDKMIGAGAYAGFAYPPKKIRLEDNVMVMMCLFTRFCSHQPTLDNDKAIMKAWAAAYPRMTKYVWMYWCFPSLNGKFGNVRIFPGFFAQHVGPVFRQYRKAGITGMFCEASYLAKSQYSVLFDQVESSINWSLAWDESRDEKKLFDEFFKLYYGPAEKPMKAWYQLAESIFTAPSRHKFENDVIAWQIMGSKANMAKLERFMKQALELAAEEPYKSRVRLFEKGIWQYMVEGKKRADQLELLKKPSMQKCSVPFVRNPDPGNPDRLDWSKAVNLKMYGGLRAEPLKRKLRVSLAHDGSFLYFRAEETGIEPAKLRTGGILWRNDEWEIFLSSQRTKPFRHIGIDAAGKSEGVIHEELMDGMWSVPGAIKNIRGKDFWTVFWTVPLKDLIPGGLTSGSRFFGNIIRSSDAKASGIWVPTFSGYAVPSRFGEILLMPE